MPTARGEQRPVRGGGRAERLWAQGPRLRVIVAGPDQRERRALREALQQRDEFVVVAEAADGVEVVELALHYRPDVVVLEAALPRLDGFEVVRRIHRGAPAVRIVVLAEDLPHERQLDALRAGASGFLAKGVPLSRMPEAVRAVARGEAAISRSLTMTLVEHLRAAPQPGHGMRPVRSVLTTREWEVVDLMLAGAATAQIAARLVLTEDTVYTHVKNIMRKLGVHSRREVVEAAREMCRTGAGAPTVRAGAG